ncbi:MAG: hypothetical protein Q8Q96_00490 [bacterium]|nr:hypothetical protein [bacterium]
MHDATLERPTQGREKRPVAELSTAEIITIPLVNGKIPTFQEVMGLIKNSTGTVSALHLKARFQTPETLEIIIEALDGYRGIFSKFIVFDVKAGTAKVLKSKFPNLRLAPSVAHPYDIKRYGASIGNTLLTLEEALELKKGGLIDGIWGDEWDTTGENGTSKLLYTPEFFEKVRKAGLFAALVTPELHGTSPGLYGGESHADSKDLPTLMKRIAQIIEAGADYLCTDYPEEVVRL